MDGASPGPKPACPACVRISVRYCRLGLRFLSAPVSDFEQRMVLHFLARSRPLEAHRRCADLRRTRPSGRRMSGGLLRRMRGTSGAHAWARARARKSGDEAQPPIRPAVTLMANPTTEALKKNAMISCAMTILRTNVRVVSTSAVWLAAEIVNEK